MTSADVSKSFSGEREEWMRVVANRADRHHNFNSRLALRQSFLASPGMQTWYMEVNRGFHVKYQPRMRSAVLAAGLLLPLATIAGVTPAAPQGTPEARQACTPEVFRLCNEFVPNVAQITACLQRNRARLNPDCRRAMSGEEPTRYRYARRHGRRF